MTAINNDNKKDADNNCPLDGIEECVQKVKSQIVNEVKCVCVHVPQHFKLIVEILLHVPCYPESRDTDRRKNNCASTVRIKRYPDRNQKIDECYPACVGGPPSDHGM